MKRDPVFAIFVLFFALSALTLIGSIVRYSGLHSLTLALWSIVFNISLCILAILAVNSKKLVSGKRFLLLIVYILISIIFYWYLYSALFYLVYGEFSSIVAVLFFFSTRTIPAFLFIILLSVFLVALTSFLLFHLSNRHFYQTKPVKKKILVLAIVLSLTLLVFSSAMISHEDLPDSSPLIKFVRSLFFNYLFIWPKDPAKEPGEKLFDYSFENANVVIIMLEAVSAEHVGSYGYNRTVTPNIDKLASRSVVFNNSYSAASHSEYSQPTFLSSRSVLTNSYRNFFNEDYPRKFVWDGFKNKGYNTAYISSQDDRWSNMIKYYNTTNLDFYSYSISDGNFDYGNGLGQKDFDEKTTALAIDWLKNNSNSNFLLYLNFQATHYPYNYPKNNSYYLPDEPSLLSNYLFYPERDFVPLLNRYDNSLMYVDKQVGEVVDYLETNNLMNNTIVIVTSDHGESISYSHGHVYHGFGVYEVEVRVPMIFYLPGIKHSIVNERVRHIDVVPMLYDFLGFELYDEFQGHPMKAAQDIYIVLSSHNLDVGLIRDDLKVIVHIKDMINEAYNLTADPLELDNLYNRNDTNFSLLNNYEQDIWGWYSCQLDYYKQKNYSVGNPIKCA